MLLSDTRCILGSVTDDNKKRAIIFEAPKASLSPALKELMDKAEAKMKASREAADELLGKPLEIHFHIQNSKVQFSIANLGAGEPAIAKSIIHAVRSYEVKPIDAKPATHASTQLGEPAMVTYERYVRIDWAQKIIFTNFPPKDGSVFLASMAVLVEHLQGSSRKGGPTS